MKTQLLKTCLVTAVMLLSTLLAQAQFAGGNGSASDPYQITTVAQLDQVRNFRDKHFKLKNDLTMTGSWTPIGNESTPFTGSLDGGGYAIRNLVTVTDKYYTGLFGYIKAPNATDIAVKNLVIASGTVKADLSLPSSIYAGGVVGVLERGVIHSCANYATIILRQGNVNWSALGGGIAGYCYDYGSIYQCYNTGSISVTANAGNSDANAGGITGSSRAESIRECYSIGNITAIGADYSYAGGISGSGHIRNCAVACTRIAASAANAKAYRIGGNLNGTFTYNYALKTIIVNDATTTGQTSDANGLDKTQTELFTQSTYTGLGWDFTNVWKMSNGGYPVFKWQTVPADFAFGDGTESNPYMITTATHLNNVRNYLGTDIYFKLMNDIDLNIAPYNTGAGWVPIGKYQSEFKGHFDGNKHVIRNLYINSSSSDECGLFGYAHGSIKDLGLENCDVKGKGSVGALVGDTHNGCNITGCYSTGSVSGSVYVGGLVGHLYFSQADNCYSMCKVTGSASYIGGLFGRYAYSSGDVSNCYASGVVNGRSNIGGLTGAMTGNESYLLKNSVALNPSITGTEDAYTHRITRSNESLLANNYALQTMTVNGATVTGTANDENGLSKTREELSTQSTYTGLGWDFTNRWKMSPSNYPVFRWQTVIAVSGLSLNKTTLSLVVGQSETLKATVLPAEAFLKTVVWTSSNTAVASIDSDGKITAIAKGAATLTAKTEDGNFTASCELTVEDAIPVTGIALNKSTTAMLTGKTETLVAIIAPQNASFKGVVWISTKPAVATVDDKGKVTAVSAGTSTIVATTEDGGKTASCIVTVTNTPVAVTGVSLNKTTLTLKAGEKETLLPAVIPAAATNQNVTWLSANTDYATVDANGTITAVAPGQAIIIVTTADGNKTASCTVTVTAAPIAVTGVTLNKTTLQLGVGEKETLLPTIIPATATNQNVSWMSTNTNFATVDANGTVTAVAPGTATIVVTTADGNKTASCTVTVTESAGIGEIQNSIGSLKIYPNPVTSGQLIIEISPLTPKGGIRTALVEIYDITGKLVASYPNAFIASPSGRLEGLVDVSHLPNGIYLVKVGSKTAKISKQ